MIRLNHTPRRWGWRSLAQLAAGAGAPIHSSPLGLVLAALAQFLVARAISPRSRTFSCALQPVPCRVHLDVEHNVSQSWFIELRILGDALLRQSAGLGNQIRILQHSKLLQT
jgi:hypothetical protein